MDPRTLLYLLGFLRGKLLFLIIILCVAGYFVLTKYKVDFIENNSYVITLKENIAKLKNVVSK
jgi:uncharacterized membrane protein required for colicin V production